MWNSKGLFTYANDLSPTSDPLPNLFHENQELLSLEDNLNDVPTKKRRHGNVWRNTLITGHNKAILAESSSGSTHTITDTSSGNIEKISDPITATSEKKSNIKTEPLDTKNISSIQHQLFSMTEKDQMSLIKEINLKFPQASCHELCCRLCRYYQTHDLKEALNWMYDPATAEYFPNQLTPAAAFIKKETDEEQTYHVAQDRTVVPYDASNFTFAEGRSFFVDENNSFRERELILLDSNPSTARQSCDFSEFESRLEFGQNFEASNTTKIVYGTIYLYFSAPTSFEVISSGSHTIVFFGKLNTGLKENNVFLFIDPQEQVISKKIEDLVKFSSRPESKAKGDMFGDKIFYSIWGQFQIEKRVAILPEEKKRKLTVKKNFISSGVNGDQLFSDTSRWYKTIDDEATVSYFYRAENTSKATSIYSNLRLADESIRIFTQGNIVIVKPPEDLKSLAEYCKVFTFNVLHIKQDTEGYFQDSKKNARKNKFCPSGNYGKKLFLDASLWYKTLNQHASFYFYIAGSALKAGSMLLNLKKADENIKIRTQGDI